MTKVLLSITIFICHLKGLIQILLWFQLEKLLIKLNQRYSPSNNLRGDGYPSELPADEHKISFAILAGHGTPDSVRFGTKGTNNYTHMTRGSLLDTVLVAGKTLPNLGIKRARNIFVPNTEIIFESCSTGVDYGVSQLASKVLKARSVGPDAPAVITNIEVNFDEDNNPHFQVTYDEGVSRQYFQGEKDK